MRSFESLGSAVGVLSDGGVRRWLRSDAAVAFEARRLDVRTRVDHASDWLGERWGFVSVEKLEGANQLGAMLAASRASRATSEGK